MAEQDSDEATRLLEAHGGYGWLLTAPDDHSFSAASIVDHLAATGVNTTKRTVIEWIKSTPSWTDHGGLGIFATRHDLIALFAGRIRGRKLA